MGWSQRGKKRKSKYPHFALIRHKDGSVTGTSPYNIIIESFKRKYGTTKTGEPVLILRHPGFEGANVYKLWNDVYNIDVQKDIFNVVNKLLIQLIKKNKLSKRKTRKNPYKNLW